VFTGMLRHSPPLLVASALIALIGAGCGYHSEHGAGSAADTAAAVSAEATGGPPVIPVDAANVLARIRSREGVTVVNLWATWCAPCRAEMPALLRVARAHRDDGVRLMLVSVDFDDQLGPVKKFLSAHDVNDTTFIKQQDDMSFINGLHREWTGALPATLVYDRRGNLSQFWEGAADENRFEHAVIAALTAPNPTEARP
jgi:thiol-disulfide isomerase/thioredoxin